MDVNQIKQRFGVIGNSEGLLRAINIASQVAYTDLSVLITGESGAGKEKFPQIIHHFSARKHAPYVAVNCGAIPEGTIASELFGHVKGAFTGSAGERKGYFETANKGTIFLDEVGELPKEIQAMLLRVLENKEFMKVGSSVVQKTDVRIIAATNLDIPKAIHDGKFREDLYYRLNTVPIEIPPLRERREDIYPLFRKFAQDFADKYQMPAIRLDDEAMQIFVNYEWPGNVRQLRNVSEQISVIEKDRIVKGQEIYKYLPVRQGENLPALYSGSSSGEKNLASEREILYKVLRDMREEVSGLKDLVRTLIQEKGISSDISPEQVHVIKKLFQDDEGEVIHSSASGNYKPVEQVRQLAAPVNISHPVKFEYDEEEDIHIQDTEEIIEENLSLDLHEKELIHKALEKHNGKRKLAAKELGISERTLYRKLEKYGL